MFVKRIFAIIIMILIIMACVPVSAFAVDPVSTATMANALAQAITAYGASHGVSMTFDVATTDGIGEGMHELWNNFKTYINDNNVPTYDSLANTMWATIYTKVGNYIGININDTEMPYIDAFWNWLLSGPAEMTKVDNEYYEWTYNQDNEVTPIQILAINGVFFDQPISINSSDPKYIGITENSSDLSSSERNKQYYVYSSDTPVYVFAYILANHYRLCYCCPSSIPSPTVYRKLGNGSYTGMSNYTNYSNYNLKAGIDGLYLDISSLEIPYYNTISDGLSAVRDVIDNGVESKDLSLIPYIGDSVPQDVYIPDNEDVNYAPLPYVGGLDIPWDDSLFGDGTGTLTDAQSEAISGVIDNTITDSFEKTLTLADTDNPDLPSPNEVYIPFLPVSLPSFNFSLSGIWHYVREWLSSLGSWFTMVLTIWGNLPYAIVVPVYATMVILIVLGVYKRFFM